MQNAGDPAQEVLVATTLGRIKVNGTKDYMIKCDRSVWEKRAFHLASGEANWRPKGSDITSNFPVSIDSYGIVAISESHTRDIFIRLSLSEQQQTTGYW